MERKPYSPVLLFIGIMSVIGLPDSLREALEREYGTILYITEPFDFSFTDYYIPEMGDGIKRFFLCFERLVAPDGLADIKTFTNKLELEYADNGRRRINLDPGMISESNLILATTKNRSHRIAIGKELFAEVTLIYQNHKWQDLPWTYSDYRSERVQKDMIDFRELYIKRRKTSRN